MLLLLPSSIIYNLVVGGVEGVVNKDRRRRHAQQLPKATIMAANFYGRRSAKRRKTTDLSNDLRRAEDSRSEFSDLDLSDEDDSVGND